MNAGKIVLGIIILLTGLWLLIPSSVCGTIYCPGLWKELRYIIKGIIPISLVGLGILLIWMEAE